MLALTRAVPPPRNILWTPRPDRQMSAARIESRPVQVTLIKGQSAQPSPNPFVHVEKNLASLGFFTPSTKKIKGTKKKTIFFSREIQGKKAELRAVILPSAEYGLPITADQDKYLALLKIIGDIRQREGHIMNPVGFTSAEMLRILGLKVQAGKNYEDVAEWAKRMTLTGISSENVVYLAGKKIWASDTFHVFERFVSFGKEMPDGTIADKNYVWLSEWQLENINNNYLLPIDLETYKQLKSYIAKALVPLLQIWLYATRGEGCFEKRYEDLCQIMNIRQYPQLSRIKEKLEPGIKELVAHGYLSHWSIRDCKVGGYKIVFYHGDKFHRDQRARLTQRGQAALAQQPSIAACLQQPSEALSIDDQLLAELTRRGVSERTARDLLTNLSIGQHVMDQLEWGDFQIQAAPRGKFYNPAGLYIRLIRENIIPPATFETSRRRKLRETQEQAWRQEREDKARLELAYLEYRDQTIENYIRKNYSKEFYAKCVGQKRLELLTQEKSLAARWDDATLTRCAEKRLRADIAGRIPIHSFQEFYEANCGKDTKVEEPLPGLVSTQLPRT
jgi:hypothetical protein